MDKSDDETPPSETTPLLKQEPPSDESINKANSINTKLSNQFSTRSADDDDNNSVQSNKGTIHEGNGNRVISEGKSNLMGATFVVTNAALGAGMLTFPYAFYLTGGWYWGITTEVVLLPFIIGSLLVLAYCAELTQTVTCEDTMGAMLGCIGKYITEILVLLYCFGCCVTLLVVMGDQIEEVTNAFPSISKEWWVNRKFTIPVVAIILIYPWLYLKKIGFLSYTSFLGVVACAYICVIVVVKYFIMDIKTVEDCKVNFKSDCPSASWMSVFNAVPLICFGFQCHVSSIPVYSGLRKRNIRRFFYVILSAVFICFIVYTLTGAFGLLTFSTKCINSDILMNYCPNDIPVSVARGMLLLSLITSYPILTFCGRTSVESMISRLGNVRLLQNTKFHCSCRVSLRCSSCSLALFVPTIKDIISPLGSLAAMFVFVLPGLCLLKLSLQGHFRSKCINVLAAVISCVTVCFGFFILGDDFVYNILEHINEK